MKCPVCGVTNDRLARYCEYCGTALEAPTSPAGEIPSMDPPPAIGHPVTPPCGKNTRIAALFSLYPGLGQVYNGDLRRGLYFFIGTVIGLLLILPGIFIWLYSIYDAYRNAKRMNAGELPCRGAKKTSMVLFAVGAPLLAVVFIMIVVIGIFVVLGIANPGGTPSTFPYLKEGNCGSSNCLPDQECCNLHCFNSSMSSAALRTYPYFLRGEGGTLQIVLYDQLQQFYSPREGVPGYTENISAFYLWYINQSCQTTYLTPLVQQIRNATEDPDDQVRIAVSLIQHIPYDEIKAAERRNLSQIIPRGPGGIIKIDDPANASISFFERYPYNVLYENRGVCSEKSSTLALLLKELGYGVALFNYEAEEHMAVGVRCPVQYSYRQSGYCFIETTQISIITDSDGTYGPNQQKLLSDPLLVHVSEGRSFESVGEEAADLRELETLLEKARLNNNKLDETDFGRFNALRGKYGLA